MVSAQFSEDLLVPGSNISHAEPSLSVKVRVSDSVTVSAFKWIITSNACMAGDAAICGITLQLLDPQTNVWTLG